MFTNDQSTAYFSDNKLPGRMYTWGLNNDGQLGSIFLAHKPDFGSESNSRNEETERNTQIHLKRRIPVYLPRLVTPLKNIIVIGVACGYSHTLAVTFRLGLFA